MMDRIICIIRKEKSFCLLQTNEGVLKFPQYDIQLETVTEFDLLNDFAFSLLRNKLGVDVVVEGIACTKSVILPSTQKRLLAFYILVDVSSTVFPSVAGGDWVWHSLKSLERKNKSKFSSADLALISGLENPKHLNNFTSVKYSDVFSWTEEKILASLTEAQNKLRLSARYDQKAFDLLTTVYVCLTFPEPAMTQDQFFEFLNVIGVPGASTNCQKYFRAFGQNKTGRLSFLDFVLGCCAMEPHTTHGNEPGLQRCRYIYRYYCKKHDYTMAFGEFVTMIDDILALKMPKESTEAKEQQRAVLSNHFSDSFTMNIFLQKVGSLLLRGTSVLFRSKTNIYEKLKELNLGGIPAQDSKVQVENRKSQIIDSGGADVVMMDVDEDERHSWRLNKTKTMNVASEVTLSDEYQYSNHMLQVSPNGVVEELIASVPNAISASSKSSAAESSSETNEGHSYAKELLRALDYFHKPYRHQNGKQKAAFDWHTVEMGLLAECFVNICSAASVILKKEPRLLEIDDPVFLLGDIHGNISDIFLFEQTLWPLGPAYCPAKILFLGDYVDRGEFGFETVAYLLALKVLHPDRFFLLRGNHEIRTTQRRFQFHGECLKKFGTELGESIFETVNTLCFDFLPLCAIINGKVFATHGGIPSPNLLIEETLKSIVNKLPAPLNFETQPQLHLPWQLLWNDPIWDMNTKLDSNGFAPNMIRKTGMVFSNTALQNFLKKHGLSHVIRAHQVQEEGFQIRFNSRLLTVFSSSLYGGMNNNAACVLLERSKIRLIQITRSVVRINHTETIDDCAEK